MEYLGIDVSSYDGKIDWLQVGNSQVNFAVLRSVTKSGKPDVRFEENYKGARDSGLAIGIYMFSYAMTPQEAEREAMLAVNLLAGRRLELPVFVDMEWDAQRSLSREQVTDIVLAFLKTIVENTDYKAGVYCDLDWYNNVLEPDKIPYPFWIAEYVNTGTPEPLCKPAAKDLIAWQYTSNGRVPGIEGPVDMNMGFMPYFQKPAAQKPQEGKWIKGSQGRWWYQETDGSYPASAWKLINRRWYYFDNEGYMMTGYVRVKGKGYYLCAEEGAEEGACMLTDSEGALYVWIV